MAVMWNALMNMPNPGDSFMQGFNGAQDRAQRQQQLQQQQQRQRIEQQRLDQRSQQEALEARREDILRGAQLVRQYNPTDDATWQQALDAARAMGVNIEGAPSTYNPEYVQGLIRAANAWEPERQAAAPTLQREYEWLMSMGRTEEAEQRLQAGIAPRMQMVVNPETGQPHFIVPDIRRGGGGDDGLPDVLTDDDIIRMEGGAGQPTAPRTFPQ